MNQLFCEQSTNYWCLSWHYELLLSITMHPVIGYWSYLLFPHILNEWLSSISIHATIGYSPHYYWDLLGGFLEFGYPQKMHGLYWKIMTYPGKNMDDLRVSANHSCLHDFSWFFIIHHAFFGGTTIFRLSFYEHRSSRTPPRPCHQAQRRRRDSAEQGGSRTSGEFSLGSRVRIYIYTYVYIYKYM